MSCGIRFLPRAHSQKYCSHSCFTGRNKNKPAIMKRFWSKVCICLHGVECHECCWVWSAGKLHFGHGFFHYTLINKKVTVLAHRFAFLLTYGTFPKELCICHHCDNPSCCNPEHLFLGTTQDNILDKIRKNRHPFGLSHGMAKLTDEDVYEIFYLQSLGMTQRAIAANLDISQKTVWSVLHRRTWRHVA